MASKKSVNKLMEDLGVSPADKDVLQDDLKRFLETKMHLPETTIPASSVSELSKYCHSFIDSERGRFWFEHGTSHFDWNHKKPRDQVVHALKELIKTWFKPKKSNSKGSNERSSRDKAKKSAVVNRNSPNDARSRSDPAQSSSFLAVNTKVPAKDRNNGIRPTVQTITNIETEIQPDNPIELNDSDSDSLPDIADVFGVNRPLTLRENAPSSATFVGSDEPVNVQTDDFVSNPIQNSNLQIEPRTPARNSAQGLLSPPQTNSKRTHNEVDTEDGVSADKTMDQENINSKRMRQTLETTQDHVQLSPSRRTGSFGGQISATYLLDAEPLPQSEAMMHGNATSYEQHPEKEQRNEVRVAQDEVTYSPHQPQHPQPDLLALHVTAPSHTTAGTPSLYAPLKVDTLRRLPATILDYIKQCEKSSLATANSRGTTVSQQQRHRERSKLFRDLYADIESRILSLASDDAEEEQRERRRGVPAGAVMRADSDATDEYDWNAADARRVEVSSYCLWD